jgi:hypothetical protein
MSAPDLPPALLRNCKVLPSRVDALQYLPKGGTIAEIGVAYGGFSLELLEQLQPTKFHAIDTFGIRPDKPLWKNTEFSESRKTHQEFFEERFESHIAAGQLVVHKGFSWDVLQSFPEEHFDYIYIDGAHSYESVVKDIEQAIRTIKREGIIQFNDYCTVFADSFQPCGVMRAVNELMLNHEYEMIYYCFQHMGYADVVVRKLPRS